MWTLGDLIKARLAERGYGDRGGVERFRRALAEHGAHVKPSTLYAWMSGDRQPSRGKIHAVLDALDVHGKDRDAALMLWGMARVSMVETREAERAAGVTLPRAVAR